MVQIFTFGSWKTLTDYAGSWATDWRQERGEKHVQPLTKSEKMPFALPIQNTCYGISNGVWIASKEEGIPISEWPDELTGVATEQQTLAQNLLLSLLQQLQALKGCHLYERSWEERQNAEFFTRITTLQRCNWQHQYEVPSTDSSISILGLTFTFKCQQAQFNYMCVYSYQERLTLW